VLGGWVVVPFVFPRITFGFVPVVPLGWPVVDEFPFISPVVPVVDGLVVSGYVPGIAGVVPGVVGLTGETGVVGVGVVLGVAGAVVLPGVVVEPGVAGLLGVVWVGMPGEVELGGVVCALARQAKVQMTAAAAS
jgi:hypothetical protein